MDFFGRDELFSAILTKFGTCGLHTPASENRQEKRAKTRREGRKKAKNVSGNAKSSIPGTSDSTDVARVAKLGVARVLVKAH